MGSNNGVAGLIDMISGGAFSRFSVFAMSISPYITASIVIQLLGMIIPSLEKLTKEGGEEGRKKINTISRFVTVALALIQATAMAVGFGRQGLLVEYNFVNAAVVVLTLTAGSAFLMWAGERITEKGIGNGISIILLINILSSVPSDFARLYVQFMSGKVWWKAVLAAVIILLIIIVLHRKKPLPK